MLFDEDRRYMARALELAERGLYGAHPNPRVGCVVVREGRILGEGGHERAGSPHAEILALRNAASDIEGATVYLTLEPCSHHGRTPPCADALVEARPGRVVVALQDPNPAVHGQGLARLRQAGIEVELGLMQAEAERLNEGFVSRMRHGRPFVRSKLAISLDGRTALANGESKWITGEAARQEVQVLRARSSAILTGIGTVLTDDPSLNVRLEGDWRQPLRVVLDSYLRCPSRAAVLKQPGEALLFALEGQGDEDGTGGGDDRGVELEAAGARVEWITGEPGRLDLGAVLERLAVLEVNEVLVEAGPILNGALLRAGLVDELLVYLAPHVLGDTAAGMFQLPALTRMGERVQLRICEIRQVGEDCCLRLRPTA